ncbi:hypothetical protein CIB48_g4556 [Xylaria polymorpha]|nr:hypothetical protein CIB48_g4556 [Xylaria polymorpha]
MSEIPDPPNAARGCEWIETQEHVVNLLANPYGLPFFLSRCLPPINLQQANRELINSAAFASQCRPNLSADYYPPRASFTLDADAASTAMLALIFIRLLPQEDRSNRNQKQQKQQSRNKRHGGHWSGPHKRLSHCHTRFRAACPAPAKMSRKPRAVENDLQTTTGATVGMNGEDIASTETKITLLETIPSKKARRKPISASIFHAKSPFLELLSSRNDGIPNSE